MVDARAVDRVRTVSLLELAATLLPTAERGMVGADCCIFAEELLERAYKVALDIEQMRIFEDLPDGRVSSARVWGPVLAASQAGIVERAQIPPGLTTSRAEARWHLVQGWSRLFNGEAHPGEGSQGHTFLWFEQNGRGLVLDSARSRGARVVGWPTWTEQTARFAGGVAFGVLR